MCNINRGNFGGRYIVTTAELIVFEKLPPYSVSFSICHSVFVVLSGILNDTDTHRVWHFPIYVWDDGAEHIKGRCAKGIFVLEAIYHHILQLLKHGSICP